MKSMANVFVLLRRGSLNLPLIRVNYSVITEPQLYSKLIRNGRTGWNSVCLRGLTRSETVENLEYRKRNFSKMEEGEGKASKENSGKSSPEDWGGPEAENAVLQVKTDVLETLKELPSVLVFFYTTWCSHCKKLKKSFGLAALKLKEENFPTVLAAVDVTKSMEIADAFNIVAVPVLRYLEKGEIIKTFNGQRTPEGIVEFIKAPKLVVEDKKVDV